MNVTTVSGSEKDRSHFLERVTWVDMALVTMTVAMSAMAVLTVTVLPSCSPYPFVGLASAYFLSEVIYRLCLSRIRSEGSYPRPLARISYRTSDNSHTLSPYLVSNQGVPVLHEHCSHPNVSQSEATEERFIQRFGEKCELEVKQKRPVESSRSNDEYPFSSSKKGQEERRAFYSSSEEIELTSHTSSSLVEGGFKAPGCEREHNKESTQPETVEEHSSWRDLPIEVKVRTLGFLESKDVINVKSINWSDHDVVVEHFHWKKMLFQEIVQRIVFTLPEIREVDDEILWFTLKWLINEGELEFVKKAVTHFHDKKIFYNLYPNVELEMIRKQLEDGEIVQAEKTVQNMRRKGTRSEEIAFLEIVKKEASQGLLDEALATIKNLWGRYSHSYFRAAAVFEVVRKEWTTQQRVTKVTKEDFLSHYCPFFLDSYFRNGRAARDRIISRLVNIPYEARHFFWYRSLLELAKKEDRIAVMNRLLDATRRVLDISHGLFKREIILGWFKLEDRIQPLENLLSDVKFWKGGKIWIYFHILKLISEKPAQMRTALLKSCHRGSKNFPRRARFEYLIEMAKICPDLGFKHSLLNEAPKLLNKKMYMWNVFKLVRVEDREDVKFQLLKKVRDAIGGSEDSEAFFKAFSEQSEKSIREAYLAIKDSSDPSVKKLKLSILIQLALILNPDCSSSHFSCSPLYPSFD